MMIRGKDGGRWEDSFNFRNELNAADACLMIKLSEISLMDARGKILDAGS